MSNGNSEGTTKRCVPLTQGVLGPDLRVNYEFGLVLGVDEFRQEQLYHLGNDYLHHRGLHGYGTVSGLDVSLRGSEAPEVVVSPGIGVDQLGRTFVVRHQQCASLKDWLATQENASTIEYVYVVAEYDECLDALVPIAGQPCSSSAQNQAASRIRRSFNIRLQAQPPVMEAWRAARRFSDLMSHVELVDGLDSNDSDEVSIIGLLLLVRTNEFLARLAELRDAAAAEGRTGHKFLRMPLSTARRALENIMTVWVTEVRPQLAPDSLDPGEDAETAILLATLRRIGGTSAELPVSAGAAASRPERAALVGGWSVLDQGRPFLLSTQVIQSLLFMGGEAAAEAVGAGLMREFVSIDTVPIPRGLRLMLSMWFHTDKPPEFSKKAVSVNRVLNDSVQPVELEGPTDSTGTNGNHLIWSMRPTGRQDVLSDGDLLEIRFDTDQVKIGGRTLTQMLQDEDYGYVGYDGQTSLTVYYIVDAPQQAQQPQPGGLTEAEVQAMIDRVRTVPFVTITPVMFETAYMITYELWFHVDVQFKPDLSPEVGLLNLDGNILRVYAELPGERLAQVDILSIDRDRGNVYRVFVDGSKLAEELGEESDLVLRYLRFVFQIGADGFKIATSDGEFLMADYMEHFSIKFEGYFSQYVLPEGDEYEAIVAYTRTPAWKEQ